MLTYSYQLVKLSRKFLIFFVEFLSFIGVNEGESISDGDNAFVCNLSLPSLVFRRGDRFVVAYADEVDVVLLGMDAFEFATLG